METPSDSSSVLSSDSDTEILRAKWMFDGAKTLDEVITCLEKQIEYIKALQEDGWELTGPVDDDYGFMKQKQEDPAGTKECQ